MEADTKWTIFQVIAIIISAVTITWALIAATLGLVLPTPDRTANAGCPAGRPDYEIRKQNPLGTPCASGPDCTYHVLTWACPTPTAR